MRTVGIRETPESMKNNMWPFKKNTKSPEQNKEESELSILNTEASMLPGFKKDNEGRIVVEFTEEENHEIEGLLKMGPPGAYVHPDAYNGLVTRALSSYAERQMQWMRNALNSGDQDAIEKEKVLNRAINAIRKAYAIFPLPIYLYFLGHYLKVGGKRKEAREAFRWFLNKQEAYEHSPLSEAVLRAEMIDLDEAIETARREAR